MYFYKNYLTNNKKIYFIIKNNLNIIKYYININKINYIINMLFNKNSPQLIIKYNYFNQLYFDFFFKMFNITITNFYYFIYIFFFFFER